MTSTWGRSTRSVHRRRPRRRRRVCGRPALWLVLLFCATAAAESAVGATPRGAAAAASGRDATREARDVPGEARLEELEALAWSYFERGENERAAEAADARLAAAPDDVAWRRSWIEIV